MNFYDVTAVTSHHVIPETSPSGGHWLEYGAPPLIVEEMDGKYPWIYSLLDPIFNLQ